MKVKEIREEVLSKIGAAPHKFILPVLEDFLIIKEPKNEGDPTKLSEVVIKGLPASGKLWVLNLEKVISGFNTTTSKTVEKAFLHLDEKNILRVYLIEMKSSLNHKKDPALNDLLQKFTDSVNRIFFLLCMHNSHILEDFNNWQVKFKGIVFYNQRQKPSEAINSKLVEILDAKKKGLVEVVTLLEREKIQMEFVKTTSSANKIEIDFNQIQF
jgi:hypothetical protein